MKKTYILEDLCCANCAAAIERGVAKIEGGNSASVNFLTTKMILEVEEEGYEETFKKIKKIVSCQFHLILLISLQIQKVNISLLS